MHKVKQNGTPVCTVRNETVRNPREIEFQSKLLILAPVLALWLDISIFVRLEYVWLTCTDA